MNSIQTTGQQGDSASIWIYERLLAEYGPQGWWPGETPLEVIVGAVLTQATSWRNVERALSNLKAAGALDLEVLLDIDEATLASLIQPSGFFYVKARRLRAVFDHIKYRHNGDLTAFLSQSASALRQALLGVPGIGPETADAITLYAAGQPVFVVDAYTKRILKRIGLGPDRDRYGDWQSWFHHDLPRQALLFNEYHAVLVRHGKEVCRSEPRCERCCLRERCKVGVTSP